MNVGGSGYVDARFDVDWRRCIGRREVISIGPSAKYKAVAPPDLSPPVADFQDSDGADLLLRGRDNRMRKDGLVEMMLAGANIAAPSASIRRTRRISQFLWLLQDEPLGGDFCRRLTAPLAGALSGDSRKTGCSARTISGALALDFRLALSRPISSGSNPFAPSQRRRTHRWPKLPSLGWPPKDRTLSLVGANNREQLLEALGVLDLTFSATQLAGLGSALPAGAAAGAHYPGALLAHMDSERESRQTKA